MSASIPLEAFIVGMYHTGIPLMIWGPPGNGKTSACKSAAIQIGTDMITVIASVSEASDIGGIPYIGEAESPTGKIRKELHAASPYYIKKANEKEGQLIFLDELTTAPPSVQAPLLNLVLNKAIESPIGRFTVPDSTYIVAAGNYNNVVGTHNMSMALMNRFTHLHHRVNIELLREGFVSGWKNDVNIKINSKSEQIDKLLKYRLAFSNFIKAQPDLAEKMPEELIVETDVAYPTPRSWEFATIILSVLDQNAFELLEELVYGTVGIEAGRHFMRFIQDYKGLEIDIPALAGKEDEFKLPYPDRHDHVSQIMSSVVYYLNEDPFKYKELWVKTVNTLHDHNYDGIIMKYLLSSIRHLLNSGAVKREELKAFKDRVKAYDLLGLQL
ncbi:MAG: AAA family ATPase [Treponema sp.]|nr:AAA family ATPase [Treponema sp.]